MELFYAEKSSKIGEFPTISLFFKVETVALQSHTLNNSYISVRLLGSTLQINENVD